MSVRGFQPSVRRNIHQLQLKNCKKNWYVHHLNNLSTRAPLFDQISNFVFIALIDPDLHSVSAGIIDKFWRNGLCLASSAKTLRQTLRVLYKHQGGAAGEEEVLERRACVEETAVLEFLAQAHSYNPGFIGEVIRNFQETYPDEAEVARNLELVLGGGGAGA